ncbi:MAG: DUF4340 domain-containing protein [Chitinophagales bacterium]
MKKTLIYSIVLIALGLIAYFTIIKNNLSSYSKKDTAFAVKDTTEIGKIVLSTLKGDTIILEHKNNSWVLNENGTPRPDAISNLLRTLNQLEVKVPVANSMHNTVVKSISGRRTRVEVYDLEGQKTKGFYIGENSDPLDGTFMLMEGSDHPFVVNIPGFDGYIATVFFTDENEWRSKQIFSYSPDAIDQIDVTYTALKDSSFSIVRKADKSFELVSGKPHATPANPEIINFYLKQFKILNAEYYINEPEKRDSILQHPPACEITVTGNDKQTRTLKIYFRPVTYRSKAQFTSEDEPIEFDLDKYYGIFNEDKDLSIIQNFVFGKLLVGPEYFYRQRPVEGNTLNEVLKK